MSWERVREVDPFEPEIVVDLAAVARRRELAAVASDPTRFEAEMQRLALVAVDPALAELVALAEMPLDLSEEVGDLVEDPDVERAVAALVKQGEIDLADARAGRLAVVASGAGGRRSVRGRGRIIVNVRQRTALTASGRPVPGGFEAVVQRLARRG